MNSHIHIVPVGTNPTPSLGFIDSEMPVSKVCLICSENIDNRVNTDIGKKLRESEDEIKRVLAVSGIKNVTTIRVDPWDYQMILDKILDYANAEKEKDPSLRFHINFTSGTHVICAAVCSAAFYIGADLYYVMNNEEHMDIGESVCVFPIPSLPDVSGLKGNVLKVLFLLEDGDWVKNETLMKSTSLTPSKLGYQTKVLKEYGLVEGCREGREVKWKLTYSGKVAVKVLRRPLERVLINK